MITICNLIIGALLFAMGFMTCILWLAISNLERKEKKQYKDDNKRR